MKKSHKILICDYESALEVSYDLTIEALQNSMGDLFSEYEIEIYAYEDAEKLLERLKDCEGLITGFLEIDKSMMERLPNLRCISVSGVGYSNIDVKAAKEHNITVCHIAEYCTEEVAEHTFSLIQALNRHLKYYGHKIEDKHEWKYHTIAGGHTLSRQTLGIFGLGKIGRRVAKIAQGFDMKVIAYDPFVDSEEAGKFGVTMVSAEQVLKEADVITNHMNLTSGNAGFFCKNTFLQMEKTPIFINVGRGGSVVEKDLAWALDTGLIRAAGLDVLEAEEPQLDTCNLLGRDHVILTPHSAFYSDDSIEALQRISGENMGYFLSGQTNLLFSEV